jgi:hypothetical protein
MEFPTQQFPSLEFQPKISAQTLSGSRAWDFLLWNLIGSGACLLKFPTPYSEFQFSNLSP